MSVVYKRPYALLPVFIFDMLHSLFIFSIFYKVQLFDIPER
jgi:hypothetical protein